MQNNIIVGIQKIHDIGACLRECVLLYDLFSWVDTCVHVHRAPWCALFLKHAYLGRFLPIKCVAMRYSSFRVVLSEVRCIMRT